MVDWTIKGLRLCKTIGAGGHGEQEILNANKNMIHQNLYYSSKVLLRGKCTALMWTYEKRRKSENK